MKPYSGAKGKESDKSEINKNAPPIQYCPKGWALLDPHASRNNNIQLYSKEIELAYEANVGLYAGDVRCMECDQGTLILTSQRILWSPGALEQKIREISRLESLPRHTLFIDLSRIVKIDKKVRMMGSNGA